MSDYEEKQEISEDISEVPISNYAILTLISGVLGLTILPIIGSLLALVIGSMAKKELDLNWGKLRGNSLVKLGEILGWVGLGLTFLSLCAAGLFVLIAVGILLFSLNADSLNSLLLIIISIA